MMSSRLIIAFLLAFAAFAQEDPVAQVGPLLKEGDAAYLKGDYAAAREAFAKAWETLEPTPADTPLRYDVLKRLTSVRGAAGEFADADQWLWQAIAWREAARGKEDPKIADDLLLSVAYQRSLKNFDRALEVMKRVQGLHAAIYGPASQFYADDFTRMAQIYAEQKQLVLAIAMHQIAIGIRTKIAGPLDPTLVADLDRLGELYTTQREYEKAEDVYRHVLVIRETVYGKQHPDLIATVDGLAYSLFGQKKYDAAEPVYKRLLDLWVESVGKDHPMVAVTMDKIAVFYADQKKFEEARDLLDRSVAIRSHFHAMGISQQATEAFGEHKLADTKALYQRALVVLGAPNPVTDELRKQFEDMLTALNETNTKKLPEATPKKLTETTAKKK
jgi:tetratricopeptide (TPR) repeat protein